MKIKLLINTEIAIINGNFLLKSPKSVIYLANKCLNTNNCWHFNIYEHVKFHAQLSMINFMLSLVEHEKSFITSGPDKTQAGLPSLEN